MKLPQKILGEKIVFAANKFTQKLDFDVLWFRRRAYKNQKEKKGKNKK